MKICVVTPRFSLTGVPLAQMRLARVLAGKGHDVDLIFGYDDRAHEFPEVEGVNVRKLQCPKVRGMLVPLWKYLRNVKPDVVFSAEDHLNAVVLLAAIASGSRAKISGSSRVTPFSTYSKIPFTKRWVLKYFMRSVMWRADALTCVSKDMVEQYRQVFNSPPHIGVYNIVGDKRSRQRMKEPLDHEWFLNKECPVLVAAGTLTWRKGFAQIIHAMKIVTEHRRVRLLILGEGRLRAELEALIKELKLTDDIQLPGNVDNPLKYFAHADAFILSSYVEGLPNVLVEAMMCGCTPVSTDCPTGPREVLQEGKYGYLVPLRDPPAMADAILSALAHPIPKERLAEAVLPFSEENVLARHFEVLGLAAPEPRER